MIPDRIKMIQLLNQAPYQLSDVELFAKHRVRSSKALRCLGRRTIYEPASLLADKLNYYVRKSTF